MREYLLVFCSAVIATYLLTVIAREIALRSNAVAAIRDRDVHDEPIPYLGGVAMLGGLIAAYLVARQLPFLSSSSPTVARDALVVIVDPDGKVLAGALDGEEGILYADIHPHELVGPRWQLDVGGHYSRPDLFELRVNRGPRPGLVDVDEPVGEDAPGSV